MKHRCSDPDIAGLLGTPDDDDLTRQADQIRVSVIPGLTRPPGDGKTFHGFQLINSKPSHSHAAKECRNTLMKVTASCTAAEMT